MTTSTAGNVRLVFVLDNDYGELTMAMYLLHGQKIAERATLLLPPRLYAANAGALGVSTRPYRSYEDVIRAIEVERPAIVLLFSGYLLPVHNLLSVSALDQLVRFVRRQGCRIVTYDPFWGLMVKPLAVFGAHFLQEERSLMRLGEYALARLSQTVRTLSETSRVLKELIHINPAPIVAEGVRTASFFNPCLLDAHVHASGGGPVPSVGNDRPVWLFVLAAEDYGKQRIRRGGLNLPFFGIVGGRNEFGDLTVSTLQQAVRRGRYPILLAPDDCIQAVRERMTDSADVGLLSFCPYQRFISLTLSAEYVFYWNAISSSHLIRLVNGLPVFYFDRGHVAQGLTPVYERTLLCYYRGWEPPYLDQEQALTVDLLEKLATDYRQAARRIREHLETAPTPEELLAGILNETL